MVSIWGNGNLWKIKVEKPQAIITSYKLFDNYPNPFNPSTIIEFNLPKSSYINLTVYNTLGELVSTLVSQNLEKGRYSYQFNASELPSGIYIYQLSAGSFNSIKKMLLIK